MLIRAPTERILLMCVCGWHQFGWKEAKHCSDVVSSQRRSRFGRTNIIPWSCLLGMYSKHCETHVRIQNFRRSSGKLPRSEIPNVCTWSYDMDGHAKKCLERSSELANRTSEQLYKVSTPCIDDHQFKEEELNSVGELADACAQVFLKCFFRQEIVDQIYFGQSTNLHVRSRLISYIHCTSEYKTILSCGKHCATMSIGIISRFWFCTRSFWFEFHFRWNIVYSEVTHLWRVCHTALLKLKLFLLMQDHEWMEFLRLILGIL